MLHPSLPLGPNTSYVNNTVLRGALVGRRGPAQKYCTSKVPFPLPSLETSPRSRQTARPLPQQGRLAVRGRPRTSGCGAPAGRPHGALPGHGSGALFRPARGESPAPAVPKLDRPWGQGGCKLNSRSSYRSSRNLSLLLLLLLGHGHHHPGPPPPPPPPPPAPAQSPPPPPANLVSGSRRGAAIGRRKAPRHNGAGRRRPACQRRGFPLSPQPPAADGVRAPGRRLRAPSGAGRSPRGRGRPGLASRR